MKCRKKIQNADRQPEILSQMDEFPLESPDLHTISTDFPISRPTLNGYNFDHNGRRVKNSIVP